MQLKQSEIIEMACSIKGWMKRSELEWLIRIAQAQKAGCVWVEIGSWMGRSLVAVGLSLPERASLVSVEPFLGNAGSKVQDELQWPVPWVEWQHALACKLIQTVRPDVKITHAQLPSVAAAAGYPKDFADVIFVDGEHNYPSPREDIEAWRGKLKVDGLLCGHDREHLGVKRSLAETVDYYDVGSGSIWYRKNEVA